MNFFFLVIAHLCYLILFFLPTPPGPPSQWDLPAGVETAGHFIAAAPVAPRDKCWQCPHCREHPALLLQHPQLDTAVSHPKPESSDPQQPQLKGVL